jgi:putative heme-binding domain-containing protein
MATSFSYGGEFMQRLFCGLAIITMATLPCRGSAEEADEPKRQAWTSGFVGTPELPLPFVLEPAFPKLSFSGPISINRLPESNRYLVLEQHSRIYSFVDDETTNVADLFVDFSVQKPMCGGLEDREQRRIDLFSIAFHPQFAQNKFAYLCYTSSSKETKTHISRFSIDCAAPPRLLVDTEVDILTCDGGGHNGSTLLFDREGYLYISIGDLTEPSPPDRLNTGQDISDLYASILRINVDQADPGRNYSIPPDNPFVRLKNTRPEVYAYGLRNPFRMSFDSQSGDLWVGDVGWEAWEMIYRVRAGGNYGWAVKEGPGDVKPQQLGPTPILPPDVALGHNEAASVTGGLVYHGTKFPQLAGKYIFGDWVTRKFWATSFDNERVTGLEEIAVGQVKPICFEVDRTGELLILDYSESNQAAGIYRLAPNPDASNSVDNFPRRLSETRLFADTATLSLAEGVVRYEINAPAWADGAQVEYALAIPGNEKTATFYQNPQKTVNWFNTKVTLPVGAVLAKTFAFVPSDPTNPPQRIETQVALKDEQSEWQFYTYRWNDAGTDADLVEASGGSRMIEINESLGPRNLLWQFGSRSQCRICHTLWTGETVGFTEAQLRRPTQGKDSWHKLIEGGWITINETPKPTDDAYYSALVNPYDPNHPVDRRARSYLHTNCAHCHMNGGNASTVFEVQFDKPIADTKIRTRPMRGDMGVKDAEILVPGEPTQSVLLLRMAKSGAGRMPHIGSQVTDIAGVRLIRQWIDSLPRDPTHMIALDVLGGPVLRKNEDQRIKAAKELLGSHAGTVELSGALAERRVPAWMVRAVVVDALELQDPARRELIEPYAAADLQVARLGASIDSKALLQLAGDARQGEKLFASGAGQCTQCHRVGDVGKDVGPDLSKIGDKLKSKERILASILNPSAEIEDKYRAVILVTADGQTFTGRVLDRNPQRLALQDSQGKVLEIAIAEIEFERPSTVSLMPEQLLAPLTEQQAIDLIAYLETLR